MPHGTNAGGTMPPSTGLYKFAASPFSWGRLFHFRWEDTKESSDWDRWRENSKTVPEISGREKRQEKGFKLLRLPPPPAPPSAAPPPALTAAPLHISLMQEFQRRPDQLDRDHFYSKLQHLIKQLACPRKSKSKGEKSSNQRPTCLI